MIKNKVSITSEINIKIESSLKEVSLKIPKLYLYIKRKFRNTFRLNYYLNQISNYDCSSGRELPISSVEDLVMKEEDKQILLKRIQEEHQVVIGNFDSDGYLLSQVGWIDNVRSCQPENYRKRSRFQLKLIAIGHTLAVSKHYKDNTFAFVNEALALIQLNKANCNVPKLIAIDCSSLTLTFSFILGDVLRQVLAKNGALLVEERQLTPELRQVPREERNKLRINASQSALRKSVSDDFLSDFLFQVQLAHKSRVILNDIHYGNIILNHKSGQLFLIDFDWTEYCPEIPHFFWPYFTQIDLQKINFAFATLLAQKSF